MTDYEKQFCTFIESECKKFNCPEMIPALNKGFKAFCETVYDEHSEESGSFPMEYASWDSDEFWDFGGADEFSGMAMRLNLKAWFDVSGISRLLPGNGYGDIIDSWREAGLKVDDFGRATVDYWTTSPTRFDPGSGDSSCHVTRLPGQDELAEILTNDIDYMQARCPALANQEVKEALLSTVPALHAELGNFIG